MQHVAAQAAGALRTFRTFRRHRIDEVALLLNWASCWGTHRRRALLRPRIFAQKRWEVIEEKTIVESRSLLWSSLYVKRRVGFVPQR